MSCSPYRLRRHSHSAGKLTRHSSHWRSNWQGKRILGDKPAPDAHQETRTTYATLTIGKLHEKPPARGATGERRSNLFGQFSEIWHTHWYLSCLSILLLQYDQTSSPMNTRSVGIQPFKTLLAEANVCRTSTP